MYLLRSPAQTREIPRTCWAFSQGVDSNSILFNRRSFQKPDPFPTWALDGFLNRFGSLERMEKEGHLEKQGEAPLDQIRRRRLEGQSVGDPD